MRGGRVGQPAQRDVPNPREVQADQGPGGSASRGSGVVEKQAGTDQRSLHPPFAEKDMR